MTYDDAMRALNDAAYAALRAAMNEDGAPENALCSICADIDSLIDYGMTREEMRDARALYEGAKAAGLTQNREAV